MATTYSVEAIGRHSAILIVTWGSLASGEAGDAFESPTLTDATVQIYGTFSGGASIALQGSNDTAAGTANWFILSEPDGTAYSAKTAADGAQILESPYKIRPNVTSGDGSTAIVVKLKIVSNSAFEINPKIIKIR